MESINGQAGIAVATVRALPWQATSTDAVQPRLAQAGSGAQAPTGTRIHTTSMPGVGGYRVSTLATTIDRFGWDLCVQTADHKFSTRLGPTASPPV